MNIEEAKKRLYQLKSKRETVARSITSAERELHRLEGVAEEIISEIEDVRKYIKFKENEQ
jgi:hypothetical protein